MPLVVSLMPHRDSDKRGKAPVPWPLPPQIDSDDIDNDGEDEKSRPKSDGPLRVLADGTQVSASIFTRIQRLGLHDDDMYVSSHRRTKSNDELHSPIAFGSVTILDSDSDDGKKEEAKDGAVHFSKSTRKNRSAFDDDTRSISSSEDEDGMQTPSYAVWKTPPKLEAIVYPEESENVDMVYGIDVVEVESPQECVLPPKAMLFDAPSLAGSLSTGGPSGSVSRKSSNNSASASLQSKTEQKRLQAYLKRMEKKDSGEKEVGLTPRTADLLPKRLNFEDLDLENNAEDKDLAFTPVHVSWKDGEKKLDGTKPEEKSQYGITLTGIKQGVELSESRASTDRSLDNITTVKTIEKVPSGPKLTRSGSIMGLKRAGSTVGQKLIRSVSFLGTRSTAQLNVASVRAASVQRSLTSGFTGDEAQQMSFVMTGGRKKAVNHVAATCQHHLGLQVSVRHTMDKLRVKTDKKLAMSLVFEEQLLEGGRGKRVTLVELRASRSNRGNINHSRIFTVYKDLVTQLDIEHLIVRQTKSEKEN